MNPHVAHRVPVVANVRRCWLIRIAGEAKDWCCGRGVGVMVVVVIFAGVFRSERAADQP